MISRDHESLMQEVLDGTATPEKIRRLETFLAGSEEGRTRMRELEGMFQALARMPVAEAPQDLGDRVLGALPARRRPGNAHGSDPASRPGGRIRFRLAWIFASGLAAGVLVTGLVSRPWSPTPAGEPPILGTMMPLEAGRGVVRRSWSAGGARIEAFARQEARTRLVVLSLEGEPARVELRFDPRRLAPVAFRRGSTAVQITLGSDRVALEGTGPGPCAIEFEGEASAPLQVVLRSGSASAAGELAADPGQPGH